MQVILSGRIAGTVILSGNIDAGLRAQHCVSWIFFKKNRLTCRIDTGLPVSIASRLTQDKMLLGEPPLHATVSATNNKYGSLFAFFQFILIFL